MSFFVFVFAFVDPASKTQENTFTILIWRVIHHILELAPLSFRAFFSSDLDFNLDWPDLPSLPGPSIPFTS